MSLNHHKSPRGLGFLNRRLAGGKLLAGILRISPLVVIAATALVAVGNSALASSATTSPNLGACIDAGQYIRAGQYLQSYPNYYKLIMQSGGNLVLYTFSGQPLWDSQTNGNIGAYTRFQSDGNFVVYSATGSPRWNAASNTNAPGKLCVQSDGNLVIYSSSGAALWATNTSISAPAGRELLSNSNNPGPWGQCTWLAEDKFRKYHLDGRYINTYGPNNGNAMYWASNASNRGWNVGGSPRIDSIAVFQPWVAGAGSVGHVAWVTGVYPARNAITVAEMDFPVPGKETTRTVSPAFGVKGLQYIYVNP